MYLSATYYFNRNIRTFTCYCKHNFSISIINGIPWESVLSLLFYKYCIKQPIDLIHQLPKFPYCPNSPLVYLKPHLTLIQTLPLIILF